MLHAPTNDRKNKAETSSKTAEHLSEQEQPVPLLRSRRSQPMQQRENLAALQNAYGNQALLRMGRSPSMNSVRGGVLQRKCACGNRAEGTCSECEEKQKISLQRKAAGTEAGLDISPIVHEVINSPGQPLDLETRTFMESRFGQDFGHVRVHTDNKAAQSAQAVNALAYTVDKEVVFASGQYAPKTTAGRKVLAHELTHVIQQHSMNNPSLATLKVASSNDFYEREAEEQAERVVSNEAIATPSQRHDLAVQRLGDLSKVPAGLSGKIASSPAPPATDSLLFPNRGVVLTSLQKAQIENCVRNWRLDGASSPVRVDGFASQLGADELNWRLSYDRAQAVVAELMSPSFGVVSGIPASFITLLAQGETSEFGTADQNRRVTINSPIKLRKPKPKCGPDVTKWFVDQVNLAMTDPAVLSIQSDLSRAKIILSANPLVSTTASDIAEGSAFAAIRKEEISLGPSAPVRNPTIDSQMYYGGIAAAKVASDITSRYLSPSIITAGVLVASAAFKWKALVNHGAKYDFKAHVMNHPSTTHCPDERCVSTETGVITICPGSASENCYESDLTGNIFYAIIGKFTGFSELTLQLGSQMAELTDRRVTPTHPAVTWDSREDTVAIHLGFGLTLPLTPATLCSVLAPARPTLSHKAGCEDCTELTTAVPK